MNLHNTAALLKQSFWTAPYRRVSWHNYRRTSQTNFELNKCLLLKKKNILNKYYIVNYCQISATEIKI